MWESICKDERKHAAYVKVISTIIDRTPEAFTANKKFKEFAVEVALFSAMDRLRNKIEA